MDKINNSYRYKITLEEIFPKEKSPDKKSLTFEFDNYGSLFHTIGETQNNIFHERFEGAKFGIGLRFISEVLLNNEDNPMLMEFFPGFTTILKQALSENPETY